MSFRLDKFKKKTKYMHIEPIEIANKCPSKLPIMLTQGKKAPNDKIININTFGFWYRLGFMDLMKILKLWFENEDRVYKNGKGRKYLYEAITDLYNGMSLEEIKKKYLNKEPYEVKRVEWY